MSSQASVKCDACITLSLYSVQVATVALNQPFPPSTRYEPVPSYCLAPWVEATWERSDIDTWFPRPTPISPSTARPGSPSRFPGLSRA